MTLQPIKDVSEYKRLKQTLRGSFRIRENGRSDVTRGAN